MNVFIMQNSIVRPLGRDMQNVLIGFVGEHEARTFFVRTRDDLTGYTISLVIGDVDCGAMTKAPMPDGSTMLSLTLTSDMLGKGGDKVCQLLMVKDTIVRKSSQFRAYVGASNDINSTAPDSATIIIISEKITELVHEAALDAIAEVQEVIDSIPADYSTLSAQVDTNTEDIDGLKANLNEFKSDAMSVLNINLFDNTLLLKAHSPNLGDWEYVNGYYDGYLIALIAAYGPSTNGIPTIIPYKENAQYTISITGHTETSGTGTGVRTKVFYTDGTEQLMPGIPNSTTSDTTVTVTTSENKTVSKITFTYGTNNNKKWYIKDVKVVEGTSLDETAIDRIARAGIAETNTAIDEANRLGFSNRASLTSSDDCNDLTIGTYFKDGSITIANGVNDNLARIVCYALDTSNYGKAQMWFDCRDYKVYYRMKRSTSSEWSDWKTLATSDDIPVIVNDDARKNRTRNGVVFRFSSNPEPIPVGENHISYSDFIDLWDDLAEEINYLGEKTYHQPNNFADTVTKTKIGVSTTTDNVMTEYDIYQYVFEPRNAEQTILLTSGGDGNEYESYWSLYRFMRALYFEGYKYPSLRELRHRTRIVVVPVWNPWSLENNTRYCPLGFQALDNLNKSVTVDDVTYPAFTSKECQAIRDCITGLLNSYGTVDLWIDMHTDPISAQYNWKKGFYGYAPTGSKINDVLYGMTIDFDNIIIDETGSDVNFTIYNTGATATSGMPGYGVGRGIPTALVEMTIAEFKTAIGSSEVMQSGSSQTMKYAQEWYWNVIANMACAL